MLNKRICRKFANPDLKMAWNNGLLHAEQIDYIIRSAIKIISHHKTLILYIYPRLQAVQGDFRPLWAVFQDNVDYITLKRLEDGSFRWRTAAFENLGEDWSFTRKCAFYSAKDEGRVIRYLKSDSGSGIKALTSFQSNILENRRRERRKIREKEIVSRMECIPALPRNLKNWIHKSVMPAYFFYDYKRGGMDIPGTCTSCGHEVRLSNVKQGNKGICPHCKRELIMKPRSRRGCCMADRETCQVIQNTGNGELLIRTIKVWYTYRTDKPEIQIYENARQFIRQDGNDGKISVESYYYQHGRGILTDWKKGERPALFSQWQYHFEADTCGHLYSRNLPNELKGTVWEYCPIADFYNHFHEPMQALPFLGAFLKHPRLEHLAKVGFWNIVSDLAYRHFPDCLDETQNRTHQILKVAAEDIRFLRELEVDIPTLKIFREYAGLKDRRRLLCWQMEQDVKRDILPILKHITVHKFIRYIDSQFESLRLRRTSHGTLRYKGMQDLVSEYRDYLDMCRKMGYDMKNSFVLFPKDLQKSHDKAARRFKQRKDALVKRDFIAVYQQLSGQLDFEKDGMKIVYPATPDDVVKEGHALHHCVGSYTERVAEKECIILFLRKCSEEEKPFYTVEVRNQKAVQVRGKGNCSMTPEVKSFIAAWEQRVLSSRLPAA